MKQATPRRRGRPPKGEITDKASTLTTRIQVETREALEVSAKRNGRSLSQEAEMCLREALGLSSHFRKREQVEQALGGPEGFGMALLVAKVQQVVEMSTGKTWRDDPFTFDQTVKGMALVWDKVRPPGKSVPSKLLSRSLDPDLVGQAGAMGALNSVILADPEAPLPKTKVFYSDHVIYSVIRKKLQSVIGRLT